LPSSSASEPVPVSASGSGAARSVAAPMAEALANGKPAPAGPSPGPDGGGGSRYSTLGDPRTVIKAPLRRYPTADGARAVEAHRTSRLTALHRWWRGVGTTRRP
jgi:hypothetical protein